MALLHRRSTSKRASQKMWENNAAMPDDASANDNVATAVSDAAYFGQAVEMQGDAKDCKVWQHYKSQRRRYLAELSNRGV